jgi:hypothetical protein
MREFHDDPFSHSSNIKVITSIISKAVLLMDPAFNIVKVGRRANNSAPYEINVQKPKEI